MIHNIKDRDQIDYYKTKQKYNENPTTGNSYITKKKTIKRCKNNYASKKKKAEKEQQI